MAKLFEVVEGWTGRLGPFTLLIDGDPFSLAGLTVDLILTASDRRVIDVAGTTEQAADQAGSGKGQMYFDPDADDLVANVSPIGVRWKVTDGDGKVIYVPNSVEPDTIEVGEP